MVENEINSLKSQSAANTWSPNEVLQFNTDELYLSIMKRIKIKFDTFKKPEYLLFPSGRFNIRTGSKEKVQLEK